ncbi:acyl-CoA thioesterase [Crossiella cryophila]
MGHGFRVGIGVRAYELDSLGHVNGAVYLQYAEHVRWECLLAAGIGLEALRELGVAPVRIEETIRYHRELRAGDQVELDCVFEWGQGKVFRVRQEVRRGAELVAEVVNVGGVLDLGTRRLVADPEAVFRRLAVVPELVGL